MYRTKVSSKRVLQVGFVPLVDSAPLIMARELGLFRKHGIEVALHAEVGWATIRDKIVYGELDAAQAPAGLVIASNWGLGTTQTECLAGLVLNLQGNAITLSQELWKRGVRDGSALREYISKSAETLTFATVHSFSSHNFLLRKWLRAHRIDPDADVRIVVVPPPQLPGNLKAGHLDGYCAGEPWTSVAVMAKTGWCAAVSAELAPFHPEKVLMVTRAFAERSGEQHGALIAALIEACRFCDEALNHEQIARTLAMPSHVSTSLEAVRMSLGGPFNFGNGRVEDFARFHIFSEGNANEPTAERARWVLASMKECTLADPIHLAPTGAGLCFRPDIYWKAVELVEADSRAGISTAT